MKKSRSTILLVALFVLCAGLLARPYIAVSWDEWGFALSGRTSVYQKYQPWVTFPVNPAPLD